MKLEVAFETKQKISIGISACLLGQKVRFDGSHKRDRYINDLLGEHFNFVSFCPEVAIGMGIPREPIRLVDNNGEVRAVGTRDPDRDFTDKLENYGKSISSSIDHLCGFVLKKDSPSCGMERVKVYSKNGMPEKKGTGLFAQQLMQQNPLLPVEEEGRLNDPLLRENFINRVYVYARWKALQSEGLSKSGLIDFHTRHKYLLLVHNPEKYRELGRKLSCLNRVNLEELAEEYIHEIMNILSQRAGRKRHVNVLQHLMGFLRSKLDVEDRAEMQDTIEAYGNGQYPLVVPIKMLQHHFRRNPHPFVERQVYLNPHPRELMLRNSL